MGDPTSPRKDMKMARSLSPLVLEPRGCRVPALPEALLGPWGAGRTPRLLKSAVHRADGRLQCDGHCGGLAPRILSACESRPALSGASWEARVREGEEASARVRGQRRFPPAAGGQQQVPRTEKADETAARGCRAPGEQAGASGLGGRRGAAARSSVPCQPRWPLRRGGARVVARGLMCSAALLMPRNLRSQLASSSIFWAPTRPQAVRLQSCSPQGCLAEPASSSVCTSPSLCPHAASQKS